MNIASLLTKSARSFGARPAVSVGVEPHLTYAALADRVSQFAGALTQRFALKHGDRVALVLSNCAEYIEILYAIWHAGLTAVPINAKLHARELAFILENSGARICFTSDDIAGAHDSGLEDVKKAHGAHALDCDRGA